MVYVLMKLGSVKFEVRKTSYDRISERASFRWNENRSLSGRSGMYYSGQDNEELSFSGSIYPVISGRSGLELYDRLKEEGAKGLPLLMVDALGKVHGKWVITNLTKDESFITKDSLPQKIEFSVNLKAYL